ncbi:hypothetical protein FQZ97_995090 [compost metagenome]
MLGKLFDESAMWLIALVVISLQDGMSRRFRQGKACKDAQIAVVAQAATTLSCSWNAMESTYSFIPKRSTLYLLARRFFISPASSNDSLLNFRQDFPIKVFGKGLITTKPK